MKLPIMSTIILISYSIAQKSADGDRLTQQFDQEYNNLQHLFASLNRSRVEESPDDPTCLKPILRFGVPRVQRIVNHFKNLINNGSVKFHQNQQSGSINDPEIYQDFYDSNITAHHLRDIHSLLNMAVNTITYIRQDFNTELARDQVQDIYDIDSELKIECDTLKGILSTTAQLARRLVPPKIRQKNIPPRNPIIRII